MRKEDIAARLKEFPYDPKDYWVVAGGAMVLHGFREETADLDLGCSSDMADELEAKGFPHRTTPDGNRWFKLGEDLEAFENWLCRTVVRVDGIPVISAEGLLELKRAGGREKDKRDVELILKGMREASADLPK